MSQPNHDLVMTRLAGTRASIDALSSQAEAVAAMCAHVRARLLDGGTLFTAGNGGSAAQALHLAEELIGRYRADRMPYRAVCLNADPTALTCIANDFGYEDIFARQLRALIRPGDVFAGLSTSGNSENIVRGMDVARNAGADVVGLLGGDGGACLPRCTHSIIVPSGDSAHVQEGHLAVLHLMCEFMEPEHND